MKRFGFTFLKNAAANLVRGGATAVVALALPHFLTHALAKDRFAAWSLMLQIAAYANYLDFGIQTAVARYLAQAMERDDRELRDTLISTAFALLACGGLIAMLAIGAVIWQLPQLFHGIPGSLVPEVRLGALLLAVSAVLQLPLSTFTGVLIGLHKNEHPALAIGGSRVLGAISVLLAVHFTHSLGALAACIAVANLAGSLLQYRLARILLPGMQLGAQHVHRAMAAEIARYCSMLVFFSFGMLLISGLDVTIVGLFQFRSVGYYSVAATLTSFFAGLNNAVFAALIAPVAVLDARGEHRRIAEIVLRTSRLSTFLNLTLVLLVYFAGSPLLRLWVGPEYAAEALPIVKLLLIGQAIRLLNNGYASALLAVGLQRKALLPSIVEAFGNLALSLAGARWLGPIGVAWGTVIAAALGSVLYIVHTIRIVTMIPLKRSEYVLESVLRPLLCLSPLVLLLLLLRGQSVGFRLIPWLVLALMLSGGLTARFGKVGLKQLQT
ncbi:MAG: hypothetical protein KGK08_06255 [Acidobacteriota bacterium]|nr:hypothetical protein [Acidobacteriota bacterium]